MNCSEEKLLTTSKNNLSKTMIEQLRTDLIREKNRNLILQTEHVKEIRSVKQNLEEYERKVLEYQKENRELSFVNADLKHKHDELLEKYEYCCQNLEKESSRVESLKRRVLKGSSSPDCFGSIYCSERKMGDFFGNEVKKGEFMSATGKKSFSFSSQLPRRTTYNNLPSPSRLYDQPKRKKSSPPVNNNNKKEEVGKNFEKIRLSMSSMKRSLYRSLCRLQVFQLEALEEFGTLRIHEVISQQQKDFEKKIKDLESQFEKKEKFYQNQVSSFIDFFEVNSIYSKAM